MGVHVKVGAGILPGSEVLADVRELRLGNAVFVRYPKDYADALAAARFCRKHRIHLMLQFYRTSFSRDKSKLEEILKEGGKYLVGRWSLDEISGVLYWPKEYLLSGRVVKQNRLPPAKNVADARRVFIQRMRDINARERKRGNCNLISDGGGITFKYHLQAGTDISFVETCDEKSALPIAALRGAARGYKAKQWGAWIPMECYGGVKLDAFWLKRFRISLCNAFLAGADIVYCESGVYTYDQEIAKYPFSSRQMKDARAVLREFFQFAQIHSRPANGPKVTLGFAHGNLDGHPGIWNKYVWGQFRGKKWLHGPAERGWDYLEEVYRKPDWDSSYVQGERDFNGNPPYGQYDVVPVEAPLEKLRRYKCLVFLGWNTMTREIYEKLKKYVKKGGHLVMSVPHLSTHTNRADNLKLYRNGDFRDLFGVVVKGRGRMGVAGVKFVRDSSLRSYRFPTWRVATDPRFMGDMTLAESEVTGAKVLCGHSHTYVENAAEASRIPVLTENSVGRGKAFLVHTWDYPGHHGMRPFMRALLRTVCTGEQGRIRITGSDRIRYAVYSRSMPGTGRRRSAVDVVYLLNTEFDCPHLVDLQVGKGVVRELRIPPAELRVVYLHQGIALAPEHHSVDLESWALQKSYHRIRLFSLRDQKVAVRNLNEEQQAVEINGTRIVCRGNDECSVTLKKKADPTRGEFFAEKFLRERPVEWRWGC